MQFVGNPSPEESINLSVYISLENALKDYFASSRSFKNKSFDDLRIKVKPT